MSAAGNPFNHPVCVYAEVDAFCDEIHCHGGAGPDHSDGS